MKKNNVKQLREAIPLSIADTRKKSRFSTSNHNKNGKEFTNTKVLSELKVAKALQKKYEDVFLAD